MESIELIFYCRKMRLFFEITPSRQAPLSVWERDVAFHISFVGAGFSCIVFDIRCQKETKIIWGQMKNQGRKDMRKRFLNYLLYFEVTDSLYYFDCAQGLEKHEAKSMVNRIKWRGKAQRLLLSSRRRMKFTVTCINHPLLQGLLRGTTRLNTKGRDVTICLLGYVLLAYGVFYKGQSIHCTAPLFW